jgi:hypothetical protein
MEGAKKTNMGKYIIRLDDACRQMNIGIEKL